MKTARAPERERGDYVHSPTHSAIEIDLARISCGLDHLLERIERRDRTIELPAPVVRDHDPVDAMLDRDAARPPR